MFITFNFVKTFPSQTSSKISVYFLTLCNHRLLRVTFPFPSNDWNFRQSCRPTPPLSTHYQHDVFLYLQCEPEKKGHHQDHPLQQSFLHYGEQAGCCSWLHALPPHHLSIRKGSGTGWRQVRKSIHSGEGLTHLVTAYKFILTVFCSFFLYLTQKGITFSVLGFCITCSVFTWVSQGQLYSF